MLRTLQDTVARTYSADWRGALAAVALLASAASAAQQAATVIVDGTLYPLASGEQLPDWLQVEIVLFRHTAAVDERPRRDRQLGYPAPLVELADPTALAEQQAAVAGERGIALLGERLPAQRHNRWQQALIDDLTTLYNPFYSEPLAPPAPPPAEESEVEQAEQPEQIGAATVSLADLQIEPSYWQLRPDQLTLRDSARAIGRRGDYQLLNHFGWRQPADQSSPWLAVAGGQPQLGRHPLEGAVRLVKSRFNHIEAKLWWAELEVIERVEPLPAEPGQPAALLAELGKTPLALPPLPELLGYRLTAPSEPAPLPAWSIAAELLQPNDALQWRTTASITADWIVAAEPFRLTARIVTDRPGGPSAQPAIATPLALDNAYRRISAATAPPPVSAGPAIAQPIELVSFELPSWQAAPAANHESDTASSAVADQPLPTLQLQADEQPLAEQQPAGPELRVNQLWSITQRRRVDAGSDYYLDHPVVSMIVRVSGVDPEYTPQAGVELPAPAELADSE